MQRQMGAKTSGNFWHIILGHGHCGGVGAQRIEIIIINIITILVIIIIIPGKGFSLGFSLCFPQGVRGTVAIRRIEGGCPRPKLFLLWGRQKRVPLSKKCVKITYP